MCPAEESMAEPESVQAPSVLVVEDEVLLRLALCEHLRECGFNVIEAMNGEEAQALILAGANVDLVLSDIQMPGVVDGVGLALWLAEQGVTAPVLLTSGVASALEAAEQACSHVKDFVIKPYDYDLLTQQVRKLLASANR